MPNPFAVLLELLKRLKIRQSFCLDCGGEYTHIDQNCCLKGYWFPGETIGPKLDDPFDILGD